MTEAETLKLNKTLERVRKLIALAEHEGTPTHEAKLAREQADALMLKAAIDEAMVRDAMPAEQRAKPGILIVEIGRGDLMGYINWMAERMATHCRCKLRYFWDRESRSYMAKVYGFQADLRYFEVLYTTTRLHMVSILAPGIDPNLTQEENAYRLHNAGYNWFDIAKLQGWHEVAPQPGEARYMYANQDGERGSWAQVVGVWKNAYGRAVKVKGERPVKLPPGGTENYRHSAANGYVSRIGQRLREMARTQETQGKGGLVLASSAQDLEDFFREDNANLYARCPRCGKLSSNVYECEFCGQFIKDRPVPCEDCAKAKSGHCRRHPKGASYRGRDLNWAAYNAGSRHANAADLGGQKVGGDTRGRLA